MIFQGKGMGALAQLQLGVCAKLFIICISGYTNGMI